MTTKKILSTVGLLCLSGPLLAADTSGPWFPALENQAAWEQLPPLAAGERGGALPLWARILAGTLPTTTAAMLEMDHVQRVQNPLDSRLRAKIRWVAARANGSRYGEACSAADLVRAGGQAEELQVIVSSPEQLAEKEQRIYSFAAKMCRAAYEVTDSEVHDLLDDWGPSNLSAIVLTLAYANFQDRLLRSLGVDAAAGADLPPPPLKFDWDAVNRSPIAVPPRIQPPAPADAASVPTRVDDDGWQSVPFDQLRERLNRQQARAPRIPLPPDDVVERQTTPGMYPPGRAPAIKWNAATYGYQPQLTHAWFFTMRRFRQEAGLPDDMRQSVFWVVTRSNLCYY